MKVRALPIVLLAACGSAATYQYRPDVPTTNLDTGQVHLSSTGLTTVRGSGNVIPAIHVRMDVANNGPQPMTVNFDEGRLWVPGEGSSGPMFEGGSASIAPGEHKSLDFYFTPPGIVSSSSGLPRYTFTWQVHTPDRAFGSHAQFSRGPAPT